MTKLELISSKRFAMVKDENGGLNLKINDFGRAKDYSLTAINSNDYPCAGHIFVRPPEISFDIWEENPAIESYMVGDFYALGVILYYLFVGKPTLYYFQLGASFENFKQSSHINFDSIDKAEKNRLYEQWVAEVKNQPFTGLDVSLSNANLAQQINPIIRKLSSVDYRERYANMAQIKEAIDGIHV